MVRDTIRDDGKEQCVTLVHGYTTKRKYITEHSCLLYAKTRFSNVQPVVERVSHAKRKVMVVMSEF